MSKAGLRPMRINRKVALSKYMPPPSPLAAGPGGAHLAEVAGSSVAECMVIWCCCPCVATNLLYQVVYKVPRGLCRLVLNRGRRRRRALMKRSANQAIPSSPLSPFGEWPKSEFGMRPVVRLEDLLEMDASKGKAKAEVELEEEMWARFANAGFWRSPSRSQYDRI